MLPLLLALAAQACAKAQEPSLDPPPAIVSTAAPESTISISGPAITHSLVRERLRSTDASRLGLSLRGLSAAEAEALVGLPEMSRVVRLSLRKQPLGPAGGMAIAASRHLGQLEELWLADTALGEAGIRGLAYSEGLRSLRVLELAGAGLEEDGLEALRGSRLLETLQALDLSRSSIPAEMIASALLKAETPQLKRLVLDPGVSPETMARWKERGVEIVAP